MLHESVDRDQPVEGSSNRTFGMVFACVFALIAGYPLVGGEPPLPWAVIAAVVCAALAILVPQALSPLNRVWTRFGMLLHKVVNPVVLGLMFFVVVTPIGLLMRALGKRPLKLDFDREATSYWVQRQPPGPPAESFKDQF
ncbi:MAG: hypothetical protein KJZ83_16860 [Burkholderiaceae bacterium]|nr:hypothetical protein [Burkholderiaceae bacterium]